MALNISNATGSGSTFTALAPWAIHTVKFTNVESEHIKGKDGNDYHVLKITFANDEGEFTSSLFCPVGKEEMKEGGKRIRREGADFDQPSKEENFIYTIMHVLSAAGEEVVNRFKVYYTKGNDPTISKDMFDKFCLAVKKLINTEYIEPGKEVQLKLYGNANGYATLPNCVSISSKNNDPYISRVFIFPAGEGIRPLMFTAKEMANKAKMEARAASNNAGAAMGATKIEDDDDFSASKDSLRNSLDDEDINDI